MDFFGVVLGGDMNTYGVARAFYEEYHKKTVVIGKHPLYPTSHSKIIEGYYYDTILEDDTLVKALTDLEKKYPKTKKILFGNTDFYVEHIMKNREKIEKISNNYIIPMVNFEMFKELFCKETFYKLCEKYGLNYPKYQIYDFKKDSLEKYKIDFEYPIFIKPADTVVYSEFNFDGKQKGYKIENEKNFKEVIEKIKKSGFKDKFIVQEYIEGNDESMYVFTAYVSKNHKVKVISAGRILMHDRTPELIGNYSAITNAYEKELSFQIKDFLEKIKFTGICHFDVQYDINRKKFYVFEMNIRQGRSNFYTYASGANLMSQIVDDYIYNKDDKFYIANNKFTVSIIPKFLLKYCLKKNNQNPQFGKFYRFALASYDRNVFRYVYQMIWDYRILKGFFKYNKKR
ncbi:MAG: hypothetical protein IJ068_06405 [Bacilli bacterium]|nr:hypothetical protein [Bacilli bacterium]